MRIIVNHGGTNERFAKATFPHATLREHLDNTTSFDEVASGNADVMFTGGAEVDYQACRHPGVLCAATVADSFDHSDKAYWMSRHPSRKAVVDLWLTRVPDARRYKHEMKIYTGDNNSEANLCWVDQKLIECF